MALRELRDSALLNILSNDSSRRDWAVKDSAQDVELPPEPDTWSVVSSTVEAVARGGINLVTRVAERLTSPRPGLLKQPAVPTTPVNPALGPDGPDGDADDELKEVVIMFVSCALWRGGGGYYFHDRFGKIGRVWGGGRRRKKIVCKLECLYCKFVFVK
jgi:hypothetical protein